MSLEAALEAIDSYFSLEEAVELSDPEAHSVGAALHAHHQDPDHVEKRNHLWTLASGVADKHDPDGSKGLNDRITPKFLSNRATELAGHTDHTSRGHEFSRRIAGAAHFAKKDQERERHKAGPSIDAPVGDSGKTGAANVPAKSSETKHIGPKTSHAIADEVMHHYTQWHTEKHGKPPSELHHAFVRKHLAHFAQAGHGTKEIADAAKTLTRPGAQSKLAGSSRGTHMDITRQVAAEHPDLHAPYVPPGPEKSDKWRAQKEKEKFPHPNKPGQFINLRHKDNTHASDAVAEFMRDHGHHMTTAMAKDRDNHEESVQSFLRFMVELLHGIDVGQLQVEGCQALLGALTESV